MPSLPASEAAAPGKAGTCTAWHILVQAWYKLGTRWYKYLQKYANEKHHTHTAAKDIDKFNILRFVLCIFVLYTGPS